MQTVSVCMIVKNERELLPQCLESTRWADEIIVVDTGSTDNTVEIAQSYGARVYHHPWENDFSLHRNQSIGYATGDWILILDADEVIKSDMTHFKKRLGKIKEPVNGLVARVIEKDRSTSWLGIRFYRRSSGIQFHGIVHNKARYRGHCAATDIEIIHYGYSLDPVKMAAKRFRTESLLKRRLEKDDKDHAALYYMCQLKIGEKNYDEAEGYGLRFFQYVPVGPKNFEFYSVMYFYMSWIYLNQNDGEKAYAWAMKGLEFYPNDVDLNYILARIGYQSKRDDILKQYGEKYLQIVDDRKNNDHDNGEFVQKINPDMWSNKTIYSLDDDSITGMQKMMGVL